MLLRNPLRIQSLYVKHTRKNNTWSTLPFEEVVAMTQGLRSGAVTRRQWHGSALGLVVSLVCTGVLLERALPTAAPPSMPLEPPAAAPQEPITPILLSLAFDPPRVALGERLFHDVRLSDDNARACTLCHPLERGGMDGQSHARTAHGTIFLRNTPTLFNVGLNAALNWDGLATTLEVHAEIDLLHPSLMNTTWSDLLAKLQADADYVTRFTTVYAGGLTPATVVDALASFERSLLTPNARFDRYLRGELQALTVPEQQGYRLFKSFGCVACHQGRNIGGNMYQKFGIFAAPGGVGSPAAVVDVGRYVVTKVARDREVFRVPSLRNVAVTAPYFHDGREPTLEGAVDTMARVQLGRTLTPEQMGLIVQFLQTLTGDYHGRPVATSAQEHRDGDE
jgi:cytochrome c peroxidase